MLMISYLLFTPVTEAQVRKLAEMNTDQIKALY